MEEKKTRTIGGITFTGDITVHGPMFDIHDNQHVHIYNGNSKGKKEEEVDVQALETDDIVMVDEQVKKAVMTLKSEGVLKYLYDYTWLMVVMNQTKGLPSFDTPQSFVTYLKGLQLADLPDVSSVKKAYGYVYGDFPNWTFQDKDTTEANRRINVAKRFLNIYRKG